VSWLKIQYVYFSNPKRRSGMRVIDRDGTLLGYSFGKSREAIIGNFLRNPEILGRYVGLAEGMIQFTAREDQERFGTPWEWILEKERD